MTQRDKAFLKGDLLNKNYTNTTIKMCINEYLLTTSIFQN